MIMKKILCTAIIAFTLCLALCECNQSNDDSVSYNSDIQVPESNNAKEYISKTDGVQGESTASPQADEIEENSASDSVYDEIVKQYKDNEMATIFPSDRTENNIHLVEQWVLDYQQGTSATLPVYWFGIAGPSIMIIESHGDKEYTMDIYSCNGTSTHHTSSYVVERKYDYVFGADFPANIHPIPIQKKLAGDNAYEWDGKTALGSLSINEVVAKAEDIGSKVNTFYLYSHNIRGSGIYMSESVMSAATPL